MREEKKIENFQGTILILGETGSGKSRYAKCLHESSFLSSEPFVSVNLATLNENLVERELFGNIKGAYTGADHDSGGFCDQVGRGCLFLDEVGEISLHLQTKLLQLLEERTYYPVGSCRQKKFNGRVIMATNKELAHLVKQKKFREDLYYRIRVCQVELKPLRYDHLELTRLLNYFLKKFENIYNKKLILGKRVKNKLLNYTWPGNIRELKNCCEYIVAFNEGEVLDLPQWVHDPEHSNAFNFQKMKDQFEKGCIEDFLRRNNGMINRTSRDLGLSKVTLISKMKKYDMKKSQFVFC